MPTLIDVAEEIEFPPGDLWSDEPPLEPDWHRKQMELLIRLESWWQERQRAEQEHQRAKQAEQENERLREQLRALGIESE